MTLVTGARHDGVDVDRAINDLNTGVFAQPGVRPDVVANWLVVGALPRTRVRAVHHAVALVATVC